MAATVAKTVAEMLERKRRLDREPPHCSNSEDSQTTVPTTEQKGAVQDYSAEGSL